MTLNARNKLLMTFFSVTIAFIIATAAVSIIHFMAGNITPPQDVNRLFNFFGNSKIAGFNFMAAFLASIIFVVFTAITLCVIYVNFEKTQSPEIIYFSIFLFGCMLEGVKIWILVYNAWTTYSSIYILLGRIIFFGRMLSSLSLIFMVLLSINQNTHQEEGRNLLIMVATSGMFAWLIPIDTITVPSNCAVRFGYEKLFIFLSCLCYAATALALRNQIKILDNKEYKKAAYGYLCLIFGYVVLTQTDSILALSVGTTTLVAGNSIFLINLHKYYMWK